jgi:hypothetical protein
MNNKEVGKEWRTYEREFVVIKEAIVTEWENINVLKA